MNTDKTFLGQVVPNDPIHGRNNFLPENKTISFIFLCNMPACTMVCANFLGKSGSIDYS